MTSPTTDTPQEKTPTPGSVMHMPIDRYVSFLIPRPAWVVAILTVASFFLLAYIGVAAAVGWTSRYFADDFRTINMVQEWGPLQSVWYCYMQWQGRYSAALVGAIAAWLAPGQSWFMPPIIFALWVGGSWWAAVTLARRGVIPKPLIPLLAAMPAYLTLILFVRPWEPLYWLSADSNYGLPVALAFVQAAALLHMMFNPIGRRPFIAFLVFTGFLAFFLSGFVELIAPSQITCYIAGLLAVAIAQPPNRRRQMAALGCALLMASIGMFVLIHSPGIAVRSHHYPPRVTGLHLITLSYHLLRLFVIRFVGLEQLSLTAALTITAAAALPYRNKLDWKAFGGQLLAPALIAATGSAILYECFVITTYAMGGTPPYHRTQFVPVSVVAITDIGLGICLGRFLRTLYIQLPVRMRKWTTPIGVLGLCGVLSPLLAPVPPSILLPVPSDLASEVTSKLSDYSTGEMYAEQWDKNDAYLRSQRGKPLVRVSGNQFIGWKLKDDPAQEWNVDVSKYYGLGALETYGKVTVPDPH